MPPQDIILLVILIVIFLLLIKLLCNNQIKEGMTTSTGTTDLEAIKSMASIMKSGNSSLTNLTVTNNLVADKNATIKNVTAEEINVNIIKIGNNRIYADDAGALTLDAGNENKLTLKSDGNLYYFKKPTGATDKTAYDVAYTTIDGTFKAKNVVATDTINGKFIKIGKDWRMWQLGGDEVLNLQSGPTIFTWKPSYGHAKYWPNNWTTPDKAQSVE